MKWIVPRIWEGGTCVIIGGGPSLVKQFEIPAEVTEGVYQGRLHPSAYSPYLAPLHTMHCIAVNVAYKFGDWIDAMFFGDPDTWMDDKDELIAWKGLRITCSEEVTKDSRVKYLIRSPQKMGIVTDPACICWNYNSGCAAINVAVHFGVKRIILLGFDMSLDSDKRQHWHNLYADQKKDVNSMNTTMHRHLQTFPTIANDLKKLGIEVINASPESKIDEFPKMNFKDIII